MRLTFRPVRALYLAALELVAWYYFGWLGAALVVLASVDAVPRATGETLDR